MNKKKRKKLEQICLSIEEQIRNIHFLKEEETEDFEGMPESLQDSETGEKMEENINQMDDSIDELNEIIEKLREL